MKIRLASMSASMRCCRNLVVSCRSFLDPIVLVVATMDLEDAESSSKPPIMTMHLVSVVNFIASDDDLTVASCDGLMMVVFKAFST